MISVLGEQVSRPGPHPDRESTMMGDTCGRQARGSRHESGFVNPDMEESL